MTEEKTPRELLIEMSEELAKARETERRADRRLDELREPFEAASADARKAQERVKLIEQGIEVLKRAYAISVALSEMGITIEQQPVILVKRYRPVSFDLVAVGPEGTLLYEQDDGLYRGRRARDYAIYADEPPDLDTYTLETMTRHGLFNWYERGRGPYGAGSGAIKPKPPPEGGKWRWIKIREQPLLETETA